MSIRRGRHDAAFRDATLADPALLPIRIDVGTDRQAWSATVELAERYRLTLYDSAYLEVAIRRALPLAILDRELKSAAISEKIAILAYESAFPTHQAKSS